MNNRRQFIRNTALLGVGSLAAPQKIWAAGQGQQEAESNTSIRPEVLFFDVNETLLDLTAMKKSVAQALNNDASLLPLWFTTMLQYSLVMTAARQYEDFAVIGAAALQMVAANKGISLSAQKAKEAIVEPIRSLPPHPEVKEALAKLKQAGFKMVSFTNSSNNGVRTQFENAGLLDFFEERLSIEDIGKYKPDTDAYDWAARKMKIKKEECMLVAAHGWDIAGALWANWRGAFIRRPGAQLFPLAPQPEIAEPDLARIADRLIALK